MLLGNVMMAVPKTCITAENTAERCAQLLCQLGGCTLLGERGSWPHMELVFNVNYRGTLTLFFNEDSCPTQNHILVRTIMYPAMSLSLPRLTKTCLNLKRYY